MALQFLCVVSFSANVFSVFNESDMQYIRCRFFYENVSQALFFRSAWRKNITGKWEVNGRQVG